MGFALISDMTPMADVRFEATVVGLLSRENDIPLVVSVYQISYSVELI